MVSGQSGQHTGYYNMQKYFFAALQYKTGKDKIISRALQIQGIVVR